MDKLKTIFLIAVAVFIVGVCNASQVVLKMDDSWKLMALSKHAKLTVVSDTIELSNTSDKPFAAMSRKFDIDLDAVSWLVADIKKSSGKGEVKAICGKKKVRLFNFNQSGKYQIDLKKALQLNGKQRIEICFYAVGKGTSATFGSIRLQSRKDKQSGESEFYIVPTFISSAYYFSSSNIGKVTPFFRQKGTEKWHQGLDAVFDAEQNQYRGSIVRLKENTTYELKLVGGKNGKILCSGSFTTWADKVNVARTIEIDPEKLNDTLVIRDAGKPDGWIRYTQKPGTVIDFKQQKSVIKLEKASYVILDKFTIKGGHKYAIEMNDCNYVRISNCDISGWGIPGIQRCDYNGRFHEVGKEPSGYGINFNGAINIKQGKGIVVERCYIHDSRITANSWYFSHPAGPQAITVASPQSCVIRYNDFVGSDEHRFNDAVESIGNFRKDGGLNRDADVYGNFMIFCSDDNIELDGGQQNVRCFDNRFEGSYCGVSIQGCMTGPSYVFDNIFLNMGDVYGFVGNTLKSSAGARWFAVNQNNHSYIFNNTLTGVGKGTNIDVKMDYRNNIWCGSRRINGTSNPHSGNSNVFERRSSAYTMDNTMFGKIKFADIEKGDLRLAKKSKFKGKGCAIPNFTASADVDPGAFHNQTEQPARPLGVSVVPRQINCIHKNGKLPAPVQITVKGIDKKFNGKFTVCKNRDFDWFDVVPSSGIIKDGKEVKLELRIKPNIKLEATKYRGAFLIRFEDGFSRPVSVYMDTDYQYAPYPQKQGVYTNYIDLTTVTVGKQYQVIDHPLGGNGKMLDFKSDKPLATIKKQGYIPEEKDFSVYEFEVPADGIYFLVLRGCVPEKEMPLLNSCYLSLDGHPVANVFLTLSFSQKISWVWPRLPQARPIIESKALTLKKGKHTLKIAPHKSIYLDAACVTDDPRIFVNR